MAVLGAWALLLSAWVVGNPPFAAPDETAHYIRAIGVGGGELAGREAPGVAFGENRLQLEWTRQAARSFHVPAGLGPGPDCYLFHPADSAACLERVEGPTKAARIVSPTGNYQPLPYLLPGLTLRLGWDPLTASRLARVGGVLLPAVLLLAMVVLLWDRRRDPLSLLGPILATTPMVLFSAATLNGSGLEIAAGGAYVASLLRLARASPAPRWVWAAAAGSGAVLALSRSTGPLWLLLATFLLVGLTGPRASLALVRAAGARAALTLGALGVAIALNRVWEALYGQRVPSGLVDLRGGILRGVDQAWHAAPQLVGQFGYLEVQLPAAAHLLWLGAGAALVAIALHAGTRRERVVLAGATLAAAALPVALYVSTLRFTGFDLQGRHVLPILVAVPLLAGELLVRNRSRIRPPTLRALSVGVPIIAGAIQLLGWYWNARRSAVGVDGPLLFLGRAEWGPPLGWTPWLLVAIAGALLLATAGAGSIGRRREPEKSA